MWKTVFPVAGHRAIKVRNPSETGNRRGGPWDGPSDWLKGAQAKVKGGGIQEEPRGLLSRGDEPTVQGDRVVPACRSECARGELHWEDASNGQRPLKYLRRLEVRTAWRCTGSDQGTRYKRKRTCPHQAGGTPQSPQDPGEGTDGVCLCAGEIISPRSNPTLVLTEEF